MIRAGMPLPPALRLRLKADAAAEGFARQIRIVRRRFVGVVRNDIDRLRQLDGASTRSHAAFDRLSADAMRKLEEFISRYDDLVDLLCWTAKEGANESRRARYAELRAWFVNHYEQVRPALIRHLEIEAEDRVPIVAGTPRPRDAFESLFLPAKIDLLINSDSVIHRIMRTRFAVEACREELERACVLAG
jgi:hypothetical protein